MKLYDQKHIQKYYDVYGEKESLRWERSHLDKVKFFIHNHYLHKYLEQEEERQKEAYARRKQKEAERRALLRKASADRRKEARRADMKLGGTVAAVSPLVMQEVADLDGLDPMVNSLLGRK